VRPGALGAALVDLPRRLRLALRAAAARTVPRLLGPAPRGGGAAGQAGTANRHDERVSRRGTEVEVAVVPAGRGHRHARVVVVVVERPVLAAGVAVGHTYFAPSRTAVSTAVPRSSPLGWTASSSRMRQLGQ